MADEPGIGGPFAATHATADGINEQFLKHQVEHGLLTGVSDALDAILHRIGGEIIDSDFGTTV